jgi:hypothetical protein
MDGGGNSAVLSCAPVFRAVFWLRGVQFFWLRGRSGGIRMEGFARTKEAFLLACRARTDV